MNGQYTWPGGNENMLRVGSGSPIQIIFIPPLFEEANRMRRTLVDVMRGLGALGFGATLPDLPATGESAMAYRSTSLDDWQSALIALAASVSRPEGILLTAAFRGGVLLDHGLSVAGRWRLTEERGERLLRDLSRMVLSRSFRIKGDDPFDESGYALPDDFKRALDAAVPQPAANTRAVRLANDPKDADARIAGSPLWRRSEPGEDAELTQAIVDDIAEWARSCAAS